MDVGCPKCQTEYELDDARVTADGVTVKCTSCGHVFRVKKKELVVTLPARADAPSEPLSQQSAGDLPPAPPSREWKIRQLNGNLFPCRDLTMLQKWIIEGKVARDDEISLSGETWKRLGNIPELASFFQIVDDAAKARALDALQRNGLPPAPNAPGPKITDTWRGGQFSAPPPPDARPEQAPEPVKAEAETLPPEPPKKRITARTPTFSTPAPEPQKAPAITETLQGGRFSAPAAPAPPPPQRSPRPEPTDEELRRAVGKSGGSGKWLALILAGLVVGGGVGWYFGVYEPEQKRLADEQAAAALLEQKRLEDERNRALLPPQPVEVLDASVELEADDAGEALEASVDAGGADAGAQASDAGRAELDAGLAAVDAGAAAPVVVEQKKSFDWFLAQADRLRERDKPAQALDLYAKAAELRPTRVEPLTGKGLALLDLANPSAAEATFELALKLNGRYGPAIMGLAEACRTMGKTQKALEYYERYLEVLPDGAEAAVARNSIERLKK